MSEKKLRAVVRDYDDPHMVGITETDDPYALAKDYAHEKIHAEKGHLMVVELEEVYLSDLVEQYDPTYGILDRLIEFAYDNYGEWASDKLLGVSIQEVDKFDEFQSRVNEALTDLLHASGMDSLFGYKYVDEIHYVVEYLPELDEDEEIEIRRADDE